jgi:hypothetical protein
MPYVDLSGDDTSLSRGAPVIDRCVRLGFVVEGTEPFRNQRDIGWFGSRSRATRHAGRSDELAKPVQAHGGEDRRDLSGASVPRISERTGGADGAVDTR